MQLAFRKDVLLFLKTSDVLFTLKKAFNNNQSPKNFAFIFSKYRRLVLKKQKKNTVQKSPAEGRRFVNTLFFYQNIYSIFKSAKALRVENEMRTWDRFQKERNLDGINSLF